MVWDIHIWCRETMANPDAYVGMSQDFNGKENLGHFQLYYSCYLHHTIAKCQYLSARNMESRDIRWLAKFHCKALRRTEVCQDNTAFVVNSLRVS